MAKKIIHLRVSSDSRNFATFRPDFYPTDGAKLSHRLDFEDGNSVNLTFQIVQLGDDEFALIADNWKHAGIYAYEKLRKGDVRVNWGALEIGGDHCNVSQAKELRRWIAEEYGFVDDRLSAKGRHSKDLKERADSAGVRESKRKAAEKAEEERVRREKEEKKKLEEANKIKRLKEREAMGEGW